MEVDERYKVTSGVAQTFPAAKNQAQVCVVCVLTDQLALIMFLIISVFSLRTINHGLNMDIETTGTELYSIFGIYGGME